MKNVRHFCIIVSNIEKGLAFYRDFLGLQEVSRKDEKDKYISTLLGLTNAVDMTWVKLHSDAGNPLIELIEFRKPSILPEFLGFGHVAFTVENLDELYNRLRFKIPFNSTPQLDPEGKHKVVFCRDFDGNLVELCEELK